MFGELPKLFDRNFAMAYFLPVVIFIGMVYEIDNRFGQSVGFLASLQSNLIIGSTLFGVISWLGGILLLVTNRGLFRFLEGYGKWNPLNLFTKFEKNKYLKLLAELKTLNDEFRKSQDKFPPEKRARRRQLMIEQSIRFPDREGLILPTPFGNTLRAFEVYPRVMYGIESIDGWSRILAVIPKDYRELMDNAKTQVDLWVNIGFLSSLLILEYLGMAIFVKTLPAWWMLILFVLVAGISPIFAQGAAIEWGDYIKAAFDVFGPKLREALGFDLPKDRKEEINQWTSFSQAIVFRLPEHIPELKKQDTPTASKGRTKSKGK
jgi:hypothetical protein